MRVIVCGGRGFIGRRIVAALAARGHDVVAIGRGESAAGDVMIWAAGQRMPDLASNREIHVEGALAAVRATGASRVIVLSTGECYGDAPLPWREDGPALGTSAYARAKLEAEQAVAAIAPTVVLRVGVGYGPGQAPGMLLPSIATALRAGQHIALTDGIQTRDFVYVDDVAEAVVRALVVAPQIINVSSGQEVAVRDVCLQLGRLFGREQLLGFGEIPRREVDALRYVLDVQRAATVLGWRATTPLSVGLARLALPA
ncbi:MAG: UDP-glucose 4-epimerase [Deltaproteobacteria bacterium]|nr:UDP-glucose 4-epimerase [Deltaproteobacteria bacterium]